MADDEKNEQDVDETPAAEAEERAAEEAPAEEPEAPRPPEPAAPAQAERKTRAERRARSAQRAASKAAARAKEKKPGERKPIVRTPAPESQRGRRKERRGVVVSSAMEKTIVVRVDTARPHRAYKKVVRRSRRFHVHDEQNEAKVGDVVRIVETRPLSKTKHWRLAEILEAAK